MATGRPEMSVPPVSPAVAGGKLSAANSLSPLVENYGDWMASDLRFAPDGKRLTAIYYHRLICVWDIAGGRPAVVDLIDLLALDKDEDVHTLMLLSPDGKYLASDSHRRRDHCFRVWEVASRRLVVSHDEDNFPGTEPQMTFATNNRTFCLQRSRTLRLQRSSPDAKAPVLAWDLTTGKPTGIPDVAQLADSVDQVSPDGSRLLRTAGGVMTIEDRRTGRTLLERRGQDAYDWAIFSPDGNYILVRKGMSTELLDASPIATVSFPSQPR